jgi:DNA-binding winged helix-turn-helix (wHTH) protein
MKKEIVIGTPGESGEQILPLLSCSTAYGEATLNRNSHQFSVGGLQIPVTPMHEGILRVLITNPGNKASFQELFSVKGRRPRRASSPAAVVTTNIIDLRRQLGEFAGLLKNIPGVGFEFKKDE